MTTELEKFEVGDLVYSNEAHPHLNVEAVSPGIVTEVVEDSFGAQVEVGVEFYPDLHEVRFATHELTLVGRNGEFVTLDSINEGDRIIMVSPDDEIVKVLVEDIYEDENGLLDIYGSNAEDDLETVNFALPASVDVFKVSA